MECCDCDCPPQRPHIFVLFGILRCESSDFEEYSPFLIQTNQVIDDAEAQYLAFFASKTVGMIRAPDSFVYPAPFNLIEIVFIAPLEYAVLSFAMPIRLY